MTTTNSLARSSCTKCVEVLQELVSDLQQDNAGENNTNNDNNNKSNSNSNSNTKNEPPPLTLLKAIARSSHQQRNEYDQWGQQQRRQIENGIRLIIPVETTSPTLMKRWTQLVQIEEEEEEEEEVQEETS
ncbi:hypothetical protein FRACYDRAFT_249609 [Fragilariopsis cylindrus CCMP1102]|uniref:Uncharacterized protein n=1 Tax=Fragilariopsis cylindrus CCMP1102 TaxID=635003 RepID=A0A1E7ES71_9STRA|nr:hypothetical protein FRACYDRAFT_249609 [Fragilariopsis cylindrus CCMP1102]|eukprot:OEU08709.1 hypothetical protein FRACYDRAFT_249609 [Fragilariopsis cylindrus CCMP1102]